MNIRQIGIYNIFIEIFYLSIVSRNLTRCKNLYQLQKSLRIEYVFIQSVKCFSHSGIRQSEVHADIPFSMKCFSALPKHSCLVAHFHSRYALFKSCYMISRLMPSDDAVKIFLSCLILVLILEKYSWKNYNIYIIHRIDDMLPSGLWKSLLIPGMFHGKCPYICCNVHKNGSLLVD